jgi:hypothetical protein
MIISYLQEPEEARNAKASGTVGVRGEKKETPTRVESY